MTLFGPVCAQFIEPSWRGGEMTSHAEWDVFTKAKFEPNSPDIAADDATITCSTSSAFLTSAGNIYSFQAPTFFQLDDTTEFTVRTIFIQISALGSGVDVGSAKLITTNVAGETVSLSATKTFIASEEELTGENGGIGTLYGLQWDLTRMPISGSYTILFNATESSLSLGGVALDTSADYVEIPAPQPLTVKSGGDEIEVRWFGSRQLQSSTNLASGWVEVPGSAGVNAITLPRANRASFFRLVQLTVTE